MTRHTTQAHQDIQHQHWTLRILPLALRPYGRLMRIDRPIGWWLLLFPCWWGLALAWTTTGRSQPLWWLGVTAALFLVGAVVMRGAGCVINDIWDRNYDGQVARTAARPIPAGEVTVKQAALLCGLLLACGLLVLLWFNWPARLVALGSIGLVMLYPLAKRFTHWPQLVLGLAFNWGALVGWVAVTQEVTTGGWIAMALLYAAGVAWTLCYDTIYAHQDKEDDILIGVKSTALKFGIDTKRWLTGFLVLFLGLLAFAGAFSGAHYVYYAAIAIAAYAYYSQLQNVDIDDADACLQMFKDQTTIGWIVTAACLMA